MQTWIATSVQEYASCIIVLSSGYVLFGVASHVLNSFIGNMPKLISSLTALLMICFAMTGRVPLFKFLGSVQSDKTTFLELWWMEKGLQESV